MEMIYLITVRILKGKFDNLWTLDSQCNIFPINQTEKKWNQIFIYLLLLYDKQICITASNEGIKI